MKDVPSAYASGEASVFKVRQEVILFHPVLRKLVNEACGIFLSVQALMESKHSESKILESRTLQNRTLENRTLENRTLENRTLENRKLENRTLENTTLEERTIKNKTLDHSNLELTNLEQSNLENTHLEHNLEHTFEHKSELSRMSRQYRSLIRACLMDLQDEMFQASGEEREEFQSYITIFYSIECVWHLCEILFVEEKPGNVVLPKLLEWIRFHFPKYEKNATALLSGGTVGLESQSNYWETVIGSLMQGRVDVVRALLRFHSASDSNPFRLVDQVLKTMPAYNIYGGMSLTEFNLKWKHWILDTQSKIEAKLFISEKNLDLIMRLVVGEELAWSQVQSQCEAWYELLAAWLFFTEPTVKSFELGQFARTCISRMGVKDRTKHLDRVLLAAMEFDILQVIKEIQNMTENGWFVSHLTDLLYHIGQLQILDKLENTES